MTEQELYEAVWSSASAVADRLASEAVEYDDEDGRAFNLTVATGIVATAILAERKRCADIARAGPEFEGDPNEATVDAMVTVGPVENARCAARVVKRKIAERIEAGQ